MDVGILTFHMAHNCGAILQAYAISKYIKQTFSCNCEIIDYRLPEIYDKYEKMINSKKAEPKRKKFEEYINNRLPISCRVYNISHTKKYDLYIIGSDQVWNKEITKGYKDEYFAKLFPSDSICVSYAASCGKHIENIADFSKRLERFNLISVREKWLKEELNDYCNKKINLCLDPVLMLNKYEWDNELNNRTSIQNNNYILIYCFNLSKNDYDKIKHFAHKKNLNILELITHHREKQSEIYYENNYGPIEWTEYIKYAQYIFTDSYHCVLFSIIYNKQFNCIHGADNNLRIIDIIKYLDITENYNGFYLASNKTYKKLKEGQNESNSFLNRVFDTVKYETTKF